MPGYCHSCPYNKFCKGQYLKNPTCPHGYTPVGKDTIVKSQDDSSDAYSGHIHKPDILLNIAKAAMNRNDYQTSIETLEKLLLIKPDDREATFLLRRARYIYESKDSEKTKKSKTTSTTTAEQQKVEPKGVLGLQKIEKLRIKPELQYKVDPNIVGKKSDKVYYAEDDEDEEEKEEVSKHVAIRHKVSPMKKKGNLLVLGLAIALIIMMIIMLWYYGFL